MVGWGIWKEIDRFEKGGSGMTFEFLDFTSQWCVPSPKTEVLEECLDWKGRS